NGARGNELEDRAAPADQVRRSGQRLNRRDAAGDGERNLWILRPERMLGPHLRRHRVRGLVAVVLTEGARRRVYAEVRMVVDQPGRDELSGPVDHDRIGWRGDVGPHSHDAAILEQDRAVGDLLTG